MNQRITKLMQKHGMAVYDVNYNGVIACVNEMLEQNAVKLDDCAGLDVSGHQKQAFTHAAHVTRSMKESRA